jgi:hypothetical protein
VRGQSTGWDDGGELEFELGSAKEERRQIECSGDGGGLGFELQLKFGL